MIDRFHSLPGFLRYDQVVVACVGLIVACICAVLHSVMRVHSAWLTSVRLSRSSRARMNSSIQEIWRHLAADGLSLYCYGPHYTV
jgi:hypothetical protein